MSVLDKFRKRYELLQLGAVFSLFFLVVFLVTGREQLLWVYLSGLFLVLGLFLQKLMRPLHRAWFWLGEFLGKVVGSVLLSLLFICFLTPLALLRRLFGKHAIETRFREGDRPTYWVEHGRQTAISAEDLERTF